MAIRIPESKCVLESLPFWRTTVRNRPSTSTVKHDFREVGYSVDIADLLFTPGRDYLHKNNRQKVKIDDLKGKTIVLCIFPLKESILDRGDHLDITDAYKELLPLGGVEFVFVPFLPFRTFNPSNPRFASQEAIFTCLFSTLPFPAVPFSDVEACGDRVANTFSLDDPCIDYFSLPYWVVIDQTNTVVATRFDYRVMFKLFGGAELYPLSHDRISTLMAGYYSESREQQISKWDQLLESPTRDFLLSSNGDKVPISSLKDKVIGLYFCDNIPHPPAMELIKKIYQQAKSGGLDFEIVQITFHYHHFCDIGVYNNPTVPQCWEEISWLTLPFGDPSCRKIQRIFDCDDSEDYSSSWGRSCLVIVDPRKADNNGKVLFEFSGIEILMRYGIEGYPFTRPSLIELESKIQEREMRLEGLFSPGESVLTQPLFQPVHASTLRGKRVLVLFANQSTLESGFKFKSDLESAYRAQKAAPEGKFEVVWVFSDLCGSYFNPYFKGLPGYVFPCCQNSTSSCISKVFKAGRLGVSAAAFDEDGKLIAKECGLDKSWGKEKDHKLEFPFISRDLKGFIGMEVERLCKLDKYYHWDTRG